RLAGQIASENGQQCDSFPVIAPPFRRWYGRWVHSAKAQMLKKRGGALLGRASKYRLQLAVARFPNNRADQFGGDTLALEARQGVQGSDFPGALTAIGFCQERDDPG